MTRGYKKTTKESPYIALIALDGYNSSTGLMIILVNAVSKKIAKQLVIDYIDEQGTRVDVLDIHMYAATPKQTVEYIDVLFISKHDRKNEHAFSLTRPAYQE